MIPDLSFGKIDCDIKEHSDLTSLNKKSLDFRIKYLYTLVFILL